MIDRSTSGVSVFVSVAVLSFGVLSPGGTAAAAVLLNVPVADGLTCAP